MVHTPRSLQRGALLAGSVAVLGLLTACGSATNQTQPSKTASGTAAPATEKPESSAAPASDTGSTPTGGTASAAPTTTGSTHSGTAGAALSTRCHTSELSASVGRNNPGAGQENFPIVLTNKSSRSCTLRGYPGAAFVSASGSQLGPDPKRSSGTPVTVTLKPGKSAWAGLTFSNPEISGAKTATPASLLVTPPDERDHLTVKWTAGEVPVSGNASSVFLMVFGPGTGA
ncbi:DUF4232 domain-containing protein [Streptomyces sp. NPDC005209]|uniref:DUF4232 domain-containing protein n=1 Tax=Streptomyces sp. NPDC005209 TaxID=3156715 RepID=UPI00339F86C7